MIMIEIDANGDTVTVKLTQYLGGDRFTAYRDACSASGARYVHARKCNSAPIGAVPQLLAEFNKVQLPVEVDARVADRIKEEATEATAQLEAGKARLAAASQRLNGSGLALYRFQETGVEWLAPRKRALLTDEPGLGKTVQSLLALSDDAAALVIVPAGVRASWEYEMGRWRPDLRVTVAKGRTQFRWPRRGEVVLASYGMMPKPTSVKNERGRATYDVEVAGIPEIGTCLIADEAHALKNPKRQRTRAFRALAKHVAAHDGRVWGLTGTPLLNRPPELWAVLGTFELATQALGSWNQFLALFSARRGRYGYDWGAPDSSVPDRLRRVSLRRRRIDVLRDLPLKRRTDRIVNGLDARTIELCDEALAALNAAGIDLGDAAEKVQTSRIHGAAFEQLSAARAALAVAKIPALLEFVESYEEADEPLVVFSMHRAPIEALRARAGWAVICGDTPADERGRIVREFQAGALKGLAGTIQAMGVGVTLTHASHALFVDLAWTPALNNQAEDRICRIGQDADSIQIERLIAAHALDKRVCELLTAKQEVIDGSVEASSVEADYIGSSPAEALAQTAEAVAGNLVDVEAEAQRAGEERRRLEAETRARVLAQLCDTYDGRELQINHTGKLRSAANSAEAHAAKALLQLAAHDPDHAATRNDVGFSKYDNEFGHSLAQQLQTRGMLSTKQWACACKLANRYRRQVGTPERNGQ